MEIPNQNDPYGFTPPIYDGKIFGFRPEKPGPEPIRKRGVSLFFAWYDIWVGVYWSRKHRTLYILPIPMVGIKIQF